MIEKSNTKDIVSQPSIILQPTIFLRFHSIWEFKILKLKTSLFPLAISFHYVTACNLILID